MLQTGMYDQRAHLWRSYIGNYNLALGETFDYVTVGSWHWMIN